MIVPDFGGGVPLPLSLSYLLAAAIFAVGYILPQIRRDNRLADPIALGCLVAAGLLLLYYGVLDLFGG